MNKSKRLFFIGGIGDEKTFGGELTKNKLLVERLEELGKKVITVDTYQSRKNPWKLWKLPFLLIFYPNTTLILSSSLGNVYFIIKFLYYFKLKKNIVYWGIGGLFSSNIKNGKFNKKFFHFLNLIIVEGDQMKKTLFEIGIKNVITIPNFKKIDYIPVKIYGKYDIIKFVFLSRIIPEKGVDYIIEAAKILNEKGYSNKYLIDFYGGMEPSYNDCFIEKISKNKNLKYHGSLDLTIKAGIDKLADYDVMLFPTYWKGEGFPGVVIDAYIAGLPIIASDWNLNKEFITNNVTGLITKTHSVEILTNAILELIDNPLRINKMSQECNKAALKYDLKLLINTDFIEKYQF